jgi:hypothetical protein
MESHQSCMSTYVSLVPTSSIRASPSGYPEGSREGNYSIRFQYREFGLDNVKDYIADILFFCSTEFNKKFRVWKKYIEVVSDVVKVTSFRPSLCLLPS